MIVRLPVVDVGQPTVIRIATIKTVTAPEISTRIRFDPIAARLLSPLNFIRPEVLSGKKIQVRSSLSLILLENYPLELLEV